MSEFMNLNHVALMQIGFLIMLSLNIISGGFRVLGRKIIKSRYMILGNVAYMLFFLVTSLFIGKAVQGSYLAVAFFDLTAVLFWMAGLNTAMDLHQPKNLYLLLTGVNLLLAFALYEIFQNYSVIRALTSLLIAAVLMDEVYRIWKKHQLKSLDIYGFINFTMLVFIVFKMGMTLYRWFYMHMENTAFRMSGLASVNILTFVSLMFAIWINFAIVFVNYDMLNRSVKAMSLKDHLTQLPNRRMIMNELEKLIEFHHREKLRFAVLLIDLDNFKRINDQYGHLIGDEVLAEFSAFMMSQIRSIDFVGRYGGEEFILVLQADQLEFARQALDRMNEALANLRLSSKNVRVTFSGGLVWVDEEHVFTNSDEILALADERLYSAKRDGKNCIVAGDQRA